MAWRTLLISEPTKLSLSNAHIYVSSYDVKVPIEDVSIIVIDNSRVTLTSALVAHDPPGTLIYGNYQCVLKIQKPSEQSLKVKQINSKNYLYWIL